MRWKEHAEVGHGRRCFLRHGSFTWRVVQNLSWHPVEVATHKLAPEKLFAVESISVSPQTSPQLFYSEPRPAPGWGWVEAWREIAPVQGDGSELLQRLSALITLSHPQSGNRKRFDTAHCISYDQPGNILR